jgi:2-oxoglutarate ferredoxin oxidoreductase subunit delta
MIKLVIDRERCKNCGLCIAVCPQKNLQPAAGMNDAGYHPTEQCEDGKCTGCGLCALMCPDLAFTIYRVKDGVKGNE